MNTDRLIRDLRRDEGVVYHVYKDSLGYLTVGIGHLIKDSDPEWLKELKVGDKITEEAAVSIFLQDLSIAIEDAKTIFEPVWDDFPSEAQEVFVNMVFNLGRSRFLKFKKTIAYAYNLDWTNAAEEMLDSRWAKQVGTRAYRLSAILESL